LPRLIQRFPGDLPLLQPTKRIPMRTRYPGTFALFLSVAAAGLLLSVMPARYVQSDFEPNPEVRAIMERRGAHFDAVPVAARNPVPGGKLTPRLLPPQRAEVLLRTRPAISFGPPFEHPLPERDREPRQSFSQERPVLNTDNDAPSCGVRTALNRVSRRLPVTWRPRIPPLAGP
jgi:hypothetical protein